MRYHALGKDRHDLSAQILIGCGRLEEFLSCQLIQSDGMKFVVGHIPPTRHDGISQKTGNRFSPDESLDVFGRDEVLFGIREHKGQIGERPDKMSAAACGRALSE